MWGLDYATLRESALVAAGHAPSLCAGPGVGLSLTALPLRIWSRLNEPLPVGFLAAPHLAYLAPVGASAAAADVGVARAALVEHIAAEAARRVAEAEPERWRHPQCNGEVAPQVAEEWDGSQEWKGEEAQDGGHEGSGAVASSLVSSLRLREVASRFVSHHASLLSIQEAIYRKAAHEAPADGPPTSRQRKAAVDELFIAMDRLDAAMQDLVAGGTTPRAVVGAGAAGGEAAGAAGGAAAAGFGGGGARPAKKAIGRGKAKRR